ncbi:uncharacterized protein LOC135844249 [Planococcus citri]|uniref:uncharacterized protein LOC135844249 n=1 Tax=Planococcus citri TaxID=170843 RepID=UPI0031F7E2A7
MCNPENPHPSSACSTERPKLTFFTSPLPLQEIASSQTAFLLWCSKLRNRPAGEIPDKKWFQAQNFVANNMVQVTSSVAELLDQYIQSVGNDLKEWVEYHSDRIFFDSQAHSVIWKCFDRLTFQYDGSLDFVATAKKLVNSNRLNSVEKYRLACCYCLEEKIKHMWPAFFIHKQNNVSNHTIKPLMNYWNEEMLYNLRGKTKCKHATAAKRMISFVFKYPRNWAAVEYFFKKLNADEQTNHVIDLINHSILYAIRLLPQLQDDQIQTTMKKKGDQIWFRFSREFKYVEYAIQTWYYIRHSISDYMFFSMIELTIEEQLIKPRTKTCNTYAVRLLYEIWISAPDPLKNFVISNHAQSIVQVFFELDYQVLKIMNQDCRFLLAILPETSFELRNSLWKQHSYKMIASLPPKYLPNLLQLCIEGEDPIDKFKETIISDPASYKSIKQHCINWIKEGYYAYFDEFSKVMSWDEKTSAKLKQDTLIHCDHLAEYIFQLRNKDKWHKFHDFVDASFKDQDMTVSFRKCLMYSSPLLHDLLCALNQGRLQDVTYFLDLFSSSQDLIELKRDIIEKCRCSLIEARFYNFTATDWQKFLEWCSNSEDDIKEFQSSIPMDDIFETFLQKYISNVLNNDDTEKSDECCFTRLNNFLLWYFKSSDLVKEYKMIKARKYGSMKSIQEAFKTGENPAIDELINWFFDGDKELIYRWNNPMSKNIPPFMANVMRLLKEKWVFCSDEM